MHQWLVDHALFWSNQLPDHDLAVRFSAVGEWTPRGRNGEVQVGMYLPTTRQLVCDLLTCNARDAVWDTTVIGNLHAAGKQSRYSWLAQFSAYAYGCDPFFLLEPDRGIELLSEIQRVYGRDNVHLLDGTMKGSMSAAATMFGLERF